MPQFEYCPPFAVFNGSIANVKPVLETHSLRSALANLRTRPNSRLSVSILVTEGDSSTLIPVTLDVAELEGLRVDDARRLIELSAERRFRSLPAEPMRTAAP
jgi:predicted methyltransferase MtxX (methanogen marker protein 4)